jgi:hypothetical protein
LHAADSYLDLSSTTTVMSKDKEFSMYCNTQNASGPDWFKNLAE